MHIDNFIESFDYKEIEIRKYRIVVLALILSLLLFLLFNRKIINYYQGEIIIENDKIVTIINIEDFKEIKEKNIINIERTTFTYLIEKLENILINENNYIKATFKINEFPKDKLINNNIIEYKIIKDENNIFKIIFNLIKGDD